jgi:signal transduction histidine kinase
MSNSKRFKDRLEDLFSDGGPLLSEPQDEQPFSEPDSTLTGKFPKQPKPYPQELSIEKDSPSESGLMGWDEYLNAIDREETLGFSFDQNTIEAMINFSDIDGENGSSDKGVLEVPLEIGEAILGSLQLEGETAWSDAEEHILASIAQQVTQHVENLRLLEQAEKYRTEAEQATRQLTQEGWDAYLQSDSAPTRAYSYDQNRVVMMDSNDPESYTDFANATNIQTQNLRVRNQDIGQLIIADSTRDPETTLNLISMIAERLSVHIENLRLLDETERSRQQLDKRAAELETVAQVGTAAATILDPNSLLQSVVDLTSYSFKLYHASVYLLNKTGDSLNLAAASGKIGHAIQKEGRKIHVLQGQSIIARAAQKREIIIVGDTRKEPDFQHHYLLTETLSAMSIPLIVGEQLIGVFDVEANSVGRFSDEDIPTFTTLASQTAIALRNAQLYAEQMETVERLRELDHLKSSFLANMSHELRTPLNSILGFAQVILEGLDGPLTEDMEMDLGLIEKNGQHLLNLINEVLDMAKIESGRISLGLEAVNLPEMLDDVINTSSPLVKGDVKLLNVCYLPADMQIMADSVRLRQMLLNIISNALKFTEQGNVRVISEQIEEKVQIRVVDTGIGIPPDKLESIFEAFSQVDTSTTRKVGGTGLGLPISRRLAEMHGGWLSATSEGVPGEGSTFYLDLPIGDLESDSIF